jgi:hypothetical protein
VCDLSETVCALWVCVYELRDTVGALWVYVYDLFVLGLCVLSEKSCWCFLGLCV